MSDPLAQQAVDAIDAVSGRHDGFRAAHAKGSFVSGRFTPTGEAARACRAAHFAAPTEILARFSNGAGDPNEPDNNRLEGRGFALKFLLPEGKVTDLVALSLPCFFVRTPEDFIGFMTARRPDPETGHPEMEKVGAFLAEHPETQAALGPILGSLSPPVSYATTAYNSIHSFHLQAPDGPETTVRWRWEPAAGEHKLAEDEIESQPPDYLREDLRERLAGEGTITFALHAILAGPDDKVDDPTVAWPEDRERLSMGVLELDTFIEEREAGDHIEVFDPTRLHDGIRISGDQILAFRSRAYDVSATRRWKRG